MRPNENVGRYVLPQINSMLRSEGLLTHDAYVYSRTIQNYLYVCNVTGIYIHYAKFGSYHPNSKLILLQKTTSARDKSFDITFGFRVSYLFANAAHSSLLPLYDVKPQKDVSLTTGCLTLLGY